jgi:hypothetical protein
VLEDPRQATPLGATKSLDESDVKGRFWANDSEPVESQRKSNAARDNHERSYANGRTPVGDSHAGESI